MKRERFNQIIYVLAIFGLFAVLEQTEVILGYSPFTLAFFIALIYARRNFLLTAPVFLIVKILYNPDIETIITSVVPLFIVVGVFLVFKKFKKSPTPFSMNALTLVCRIFETAQALADGVGVYSVLTGIILGQVFAFTACLSCFAICVRGARAKFTLDELISLCGTLIVFSAGFYTLSVLGVRPYFAFATFISLVSTYALGSSGMVLGAVIGLGAGFSGDVFFAITLVCGSLVTLAFRGVSPYLSAVGFLFAVCGAGYYFGESAFSPEAVITLSLGALAFCLLPNKIMESVAELLSAIRERNGGRGIVNRNRMDTSRKLSSLATLFWELSALVGENKNNDKGEDEQIEDLAESVKLSLCGNCPKMEECEGILSGKTSELLRPIAESAVKRGKATLLELPSYFTGSCIRVGELIPLVNQKKEEIIKKVKEDSYTVSGRRLLGEQLFEAGELLSSFASEMRKSVGFEVQKERIVVDELAYKNVVCSEAVIEWGGDKVIVFAKNGEERRRAIEKVVSSVMKQKMHASVDRCSGLNGFDVVTLEKKSELDMAFGEASSIKDGEERGGDSRLIMRPARDRYIIAIADGMGSGEKAERASARAVSMVESFYKAGFSHGKVVNLVNKMLTFTGEDCYNTLDMCVCDMKSKSCDFIKMGASPSYIKRGERVEAVESEALPMGVFQEVTPTVIHKELMKGDMIVLVSDGVTDSIGGEELINLISAIKTPNPQEMANLIKKRATALGAVDDVSVSVGKVYGQN